MIFNVFLFSLKGYSETLSSLKSQGIMRFFFETGNVSFSVWVIKLLILGYCCLCLLKEVKAIQCSSLEEVATPIFISLFCYLTVLFHISFHFFSMNMIYTIKKRKIFRKINCIQRNLDDKGLARH